MKKNSIIPIFFASDKNYVPYLTVAVKSLVDKTSENFVYKIHILSNDLQNSDIKEIKSYEKQNVEISIVDVNRKIEDIKDKVALRDYYSVSIYFRLFIPSMFPQYEKAIYLDSDIVLNDDVANLFNHDIENCYVGAVLDETLFSNKDFTYYANEALGVSEKQYFNSGVLVMNLEKFRQYNIEEDFYNWVNYQQYGYIAPDQDYLNCVCKNDVKYLPLGWNKMPLGEELTSEELHLVHFNMFFKPWKYENVMFEDYFWNVAKTTSYYKFLKQQQTSYSDNNKEKDQLALKNLIKMALNIANADINYKKVILKK